ncbi:MAG TPA: CAP domain-containing protein [Solirubrobacteraceae bacterium]
MTTSARGFAAALFAGVTLTLLWLVAAPAVASTAKKSGHARSATAGRRKHVKHVPTVLGVSMVSTPTAHKAKPSSASVAPPAVPGRCQNTGLVPNASNVGAIEAATLCLVNRARQAAGVAALAGNAALGRAAVGHSDQMVAENYFDHVGPDGNGPTQRVIAAGFTRSTAVIAENIAAATMSDATPAATVASWMASAGHRVNILDPDFRETGIGVAAAAPALLGRLAGGTYTEDFA